MSFLTLDRRKRRIHFRGALNPVHGMPHKISKEWETLGPREALSLTSSLGSRVVAAEKEAITPDGRKRAVSELLAVLENGLEEIYVELLPKLTATEKRDLAMVELTFTNKNPIEKLGLGGWLSYCERGRITDLASERLGLPRVDLSALKTLVPVRNRVVHEDYIPSTDEYQSVLKEVRSFLLSTKLVKEFPAMFQGTNPHPGKDIYDLTRRLRLALAKDPDMSISDIFSDPHDELRMYEVSVDCEFRGAYVEEGKIIIELHSNQAVFSDGIMEKVLDEIEKKLDLKLRPFKGELDGVPRAVRFSGDMSELGWEYS